MNKYFKVLAVASLAFSLVSCLKDKEFENNEYGLTNTDANKVVELGERFIQEHAASKALDFKDTALVLDFVTVTLTTDKAAPEDLHITLDTTGQRDIINSSFDTSVVIFPSTLYTLPEGLVVTIPKGSFTGTLKVKTNAINFDPSTVYGLGFTIKSVDRPGYVGSKTYGTYAVTIGAKNKYDGQYEITGTLVDANGLYTGDYGDPDYPRTYNLITTGANSGKMYDFYWESETYIVVNILSGLGANTAIKPEITVDPVTLKVTMRDLAAPTTPVTVGPNSKFNSSDGSIDLDWTIGRWHATEHWEYIGPR